MKLLVDRTALVIVGAWNPAILNPNWIAQQILGYPAEKQFQVNAEFLVVGPGAPVRLNFEGLSLVPANDRLTFNFDPQNADQTERTVSTAARCLETLIHTPISAIGINFEYLADTIEAPLQKRFEPLNDVVGFLDGTEPRVERQSFRLRIAVADHIVNLTCATEGKGVRFSINHHFEAHGASAGAEVLKKEKLIPKLLEMSEKLVKGMTEGETK